ncbi:MAG TPA: PstS family phosphate ABC transporter substrate-binding protein [Saprospiraceae bacterium]|jgi:phosphate transport system substrate-binding protein|nr:PstS family phosphate ABC transporter substrate-binding protein [Saprospiraceae bacterium]HRP84687.1 PstS family phosphate ABC transporter substrate-binding protein [Saprospiraceae bacterium]
MKRIITILLSILGVTFAADAQKIKGSETVLPISEKAAQVFMKSNNSGNVTVTGGGSGVGISSLIGRSADIAQTSRKMKFSEKQKFQRSGKAVKEVIIAYDGLAVIINPANKIKKLTREQLEDIFTGKIKNWKDVGGADMKIIPYARETSSGTYEFFKEVVLKNKNYLSGIMSMPANGSLIQSVSQTKGAIAYVGLAYVSASVKTISVSFDKGKSYVFPSETSVKNKTYPVVRPLYYYYLTKSEFLVKKFINFILSPAGQKIVREVGYISVK